MDKSTVQPQQAIDWQAISNAIAQGVIPAPAGSNENGEPYWIFNTQKITWQQVQSYVLQAQQKQASSGKGLEAGGGLESMPQMPSMPNFEATLENKVETKVESFAERAFEKAPEQQVVQKADVAKPQVAPQTQQKSKGASLIGQSAPLTKVDPSDPQSMLSFSKAHKGEAIDSSNRFLAEFLEKVLQVLSLDVN